jgi:hypothetical protein
MRLKKRNCDEVGKLGRRGGLTERVGLLGDRQRAARL